MSHEQKYVCGLACWVLVPALILAVAASSAAGNPSTRLVVISSAQSLAPGVEGEIDVASLIARAIESRVGSELEVLLHAIEPAAKMPEADTIRALAEASSARAVIVPLFVNKPGTSAAVVEVDVRSGHSGASLSRHRLDLDISPEFEVALGAEVERVVGEILRDLEVEKTTDVTERGADSEVPPAAAAAGEEGDREASAFAIFNNDDPIEIQSQELEVTAEGESKRIIFRKDVRVIQGDVTMFADYLEAFYPAGASNPERLDARGRIRVIDKKREIHCNEATYLRESEIVTCRGDAILLQGCDEVRGAEIVFNLSSEQVKVLGGAAMILRPSSGDSDRDCRVGGAG